MLDLFFPKRQAVTPIDWWRGGSTAWGGRVRTQGGVLVDDNLALTLGACWSCSRIITEAASSCSLKIYRREDNGDVAEAPAHYLSPLLGAAPNPDMGIVPFHEGRTLHAVNAGNGFAEIEWDNLEPSRRRRVVALWPIHPARVRPITARDNERAYNYGLRYLVRNNDGSSTALRADEMLHVPGALSEDGIWGKGTIQHARETLGMGIATERHGATQFGAGNVPRVLITLPGMKDAEARRNYRREWKELYGSPDSAEVCILPVDAKLEKLSFSNEDAQFLQTRLANVREVARWYKVPGHLLNDLEKASYNSIEQLSLEFVIYGLLPWLRRFEGQCNLKLILPEDRGRYYVEHQLGGLLRGDIVARMNAYKTAIGIGLMSINEARRLEGLNSIGPAGNLHYVPLNMTTAEAMAAGPPPPGPAKMPADGQAAALPPASVAPGNDASALPAPAVCASVDRKAARAVLVDALGRMFRKEANAANRAAGRADFSAWLDGFYEHHRELMAEALGPSLQVLGDGPTADELADRLVAESKTALGHAYDHDTPAQFRQRLSSWGSARAEQTADDILAGLEQGATNA